MKSRLAAKIIAATFALSGLGIGIAGPAAAYDCSSTLVGDYELWDTYGADREVGWLKRWDLPFVCSSDSSESKTSYTTSMLFDRSKHTIKHFIYHQETGEFLRGNTWGPKTDQLTTPNLKNRTEVYYHTSALTAWGYERRLSIQCKTSHNC